MSASADREVIRSGGGIGASSSGGLGRVGVIGLGLIGGSIALGLSGNHDVSGYDSDPGVMSDANGRGIPTASLDCIIRRSDLVVVCVPVDAIRRTFQSISEAVGLDSGRTPSQPPVVTDTCPVQRESAAASAVLAGMGVPFVGGHPMAGKEVGGFRNAEASIFRGSPWALLLDDDTSLDSYLRTMVLPLALGARVVPARPEHHDRAVGLVSHLPHVIAAALARLAASSDVLGLPAALAGGSFRDMIRVAGGSPEMAATMCSFNSDMLSDAQRRFAMDIEVAMSDSQYDMLLDYFMTATLSAERLVRIRTGGPVPSRTQEAPGGSVTWPAGRLEPMRSWLTDLGLAGGHVTGIDGDGASGVTLSYWAPPGN